MRAPAVLVVEDDAPIRRFLRTALEAESYSVVEAAAIAQGLERAVAAQPDLVVLDLGLPDGDGLEFVRTLRAWSQAPILVLTARTAEDDKIRALDAGADDYLTKPFPAGELLARVRALLRRSRPAPAAPVVEFGDVRLDLAARSVSRAGAPVRLTRTEFDLLALLVANTGKVMTQRRLLREIWGPSLVDSSHYLRVYVGRLRRKLEHDPAQPRHLLTETGVGYRFQP
ncbi:MAG: response regulator [Gammaproteobacteria bacterium]